MHFEMYTWPHYILMISPIIITCVIIKVMRGKSFEKQHLVGKVMAGILILFMVIRNINNFFMGNVVSDLIPLQLCHLSAWLIVPGAIFTRNRYLSLIAITLSLPAGYISLVFADPLVHYSSLFEVSAICYVILHVFIVIGALYLIYIYRPKINFKDFLKSFAILAAYFLITIVLNNIFISHGVPSFYFYSVIPEPGTPLETFYNWGTNYRVFGLTINPIYNLLVLSIATAIMLSIYTIYNIIPENKGANHQSKRLNI
ncbi:TMEM164 family acyltransferase [Neobacillus bataviensis]|uniref:TMEM164 family acyltransferase n=1 Tax=Neobacillus bataviensis TaxID=220685 RepID=UPI001CBF5493|nr:YwaF family protein [Neobacillus bataviensis]